MEFNEFGSDINVVWRGESVPGSNNVSITNYGFSPLCMATYSACEGMRSVYLASALHSFLVKSMCQSSGDRTQPINPEEEARESCVLLSI